MGSSARQRLGSSRNDFPHVRYLVHVRFPPSYGLSTGRSDGANIPKYTKTEDSEIDLLND